MKQILKIFFSFPILLLAGEAESNLIPNGGFESGMRPGWFGGKFNDGEGGISIIEENVAEGKKAVYLTHKKGKGGTQLLSQPFGIPDKGSLKFSFQYKGRGVVSVRFKEKKDGKIIVAKTVNGEALTFGRSLKAESNWTKQEYVIQIPEQASGKQMYATIYSAVWNDGYLALDDMHLIPQQDSGIIQPLKNKLVIQPVLPLSAKEKTMYKPLPDNGLRMDYSGNCLLRNGKPYFWISDGDPVGGGQSGVAEAWLGRLLKVTIASISPPSPRSVKKDSHGNLQVVPRYDTAMSMFSLMRELYRNKIFSEIYFQDWYLYSPFRKYREQYPELAKAFVTGNHFFGCEPGDPNGRKLLEYQKAFILRYTKDFPFMGVEDYRELGYYPNHPRALEVFRSFAKKKYGTLKEANRVWHKDFKDWKNVYPPHLDESGMLGYAAIMRLRSNALKQFPEMYYDWLICCTEDLTRLLASMAEDYRKWTRAGLFHDMRSHQLEDEKYMTSNPELLEGLFDMTFLHIGTTMYDTKGKVLPDEFLNHTMTELFAMNFMRTVSKKALMNSELIVSDVINPTKEADYKDADLGRLLGRWHFKEAVENDLSPAKPETSITNWKTMSVPGTWDSLEEFKEVKKAWYCKDFTVSGGHAQDYRDGSRKFYLVGKGIAQSGKIYLNGTYVGEVKGWSRNYRFDIGGLLNLGGSNRIAILVDGTTSHSHGLRFFIHILKDSMMHTNTAFAERQYRALLWNYMMNGYSAVNLWNWNTLYRPYMPSIADEINSFTEEILPNARNAKSRIAYLYPYYSARGLPFPRAKRFHDFMEYYKAVLFAGHNPDIMGEKTFVRDVTPEKYDVAVVPYATYLYGNTYDHLLDYIRTGGTAVVTFDSLVQTFEKYQDTGFEDFANIKTGIEKSGEKIRIGNKFFHVNRGDVCGKFGYSLIAPGADIRAVWQDGTPAVAVRKIGKGKVIFVGARLDSRALTEILKNDLPQPEFTLRTTRDTGEFPALERKIRGTGQHKLLYIQNWGGTTQEVEISLPEKLSTFTATPVLGKFENLAGGKFKVNIPGGSPVVLQLSSGRVTPLPLKNTVAKRTAILKKITELNTDKNGEKGNVLFMSELAVFHRNVGRVLYPDMVDAIQRMGFGTIERPEAEWLPENLKQYKLVVLSEACSNPYAPSRMGNTRLKKLIADVAEYVKNGGSMILLTYSGMTPNANARLLNELGRHVGISLGGLAMDEKNCAFGDPLQVKGVKMEKHPITRNIKESCFFPLRAIRIGKNSTMKNVVMTAKGEGIVAVGTYGKGKILVSSDLTWLQPFRLELYDNAELLCNSLAWLLRNPIKTEFVEEFKQNRFLTTGIMEKIEQKEGQR